MIDKIRQFYKENKSIIIYIIIGGVTTFVNWVVFSACFYLFSFPNVLSNVISWIFAVTVAFVGNKVYVFESRSWKHGVWIAELLKFAGGRIGTGVLEIGCMWLFVDLLHFHVLLMKIIVSVIVVILNYIISKVFVFKKENQHEGSNSCRRIRDTDQRGKSSETETNG